MYVSHSREYGANNIALSVRSPQATDKRVPH